MFVSRITRNMSFRPFLISTRGFSISTIRSAAGDAGSTRSGGMSQGDAFSRREEASENLYIKQQEAEKLKLLKEKIRKQKEDLSIDEAAAKQMEESSGKSSGSESS